MWLPLLSSQWHIAVRLLGTAAIWLFTALVSYVILNEVQRYRARVKGLSGPRGWPVIGNIWDIRQRAAQKYVEWSRIHGDVYQVQLGNIPVVVVNSAAAAKELWLSNSQALASRPQTYTYHKASPRVASNSAAFSIGTSPYDESLKSRKKGVAVALNRPAIQSYVPYLDIESRDFLRHLWVYGEKGKKPLSPLPHIQRLAMSLAVTINWGIRITTIDDPLFREIIEVEEELNNIRSTTANLQDFVPLLRLNPINKNSAKAKAARSRRDKYLSTLNKDLADKVAAGTNNPCIQASVLTYKEKPLSEVELSSISLSMLAGGFETVSNTVQFTIGYLSQHIDIQDKAFEAIRAFHSGDQLPDAADDLGCPYVVGITKEALRYFSVIPLLLPRESIKDVVHNGVFMPKGTTFYMNAFSCNRDPHLWKDPDVFRPERWIEKPDAPLFTFGMGYRMCSAHMLATRELYLLFMRLLGNFRIEPCGKIDCDPVTGVRDPRELVLQPRPYQVYCIPRDAEAVERAIF